MKNCLYIVIPCFNEQEVLLETAKRTKSKLDELINKDKISIKSKIVFVNDGSRDDTWNIIKSLHNENDIFEGINLSKNEGHQKAIIAGLMIVKQYADMVITMDADLQDDINAIDEMVDKYLNGCDIVYGVRNRRDKDTPFKRLTAQWYYRFIKALGSDIIYNHADYRLMSKRALNSLENFSEVNLFLRGIVPMIGFKTDKIMYDRVERFAGESKYPLKKMISFAFEGITSLSVKPIKMITLLGFILFLISIIMFIYTLSSYFSGKAVASGWSSLIISVWAIGGLLLLAIGIVGEYIGKIYLETKRRPRYIIEEFLHEEKNEN